MKLTPLILDKPVLEFTYYLQLIIKRNVVCEKHCFVHVFFCLSLRNKVLSNDSESVVFGCIVDIFNLFDPSVSGLNHTRGSSTDCIST